MLKLYTQEDVFLYFESLQFLSVSFKNTESYIVSSMSFIIYHWS